MAGLGRAPERCAGGGTSKKGDGGREKGDGIEKEGWKEWESKEGREGE